MNDTLEGNKLIAEFMGWQNNGDRYFDKPNNKTFLLYPNEMKFNSSWDWLMPVVEKIETFEDSTDDFEGGYSVSIQAYLCEVQNMMGGHISDGFEETKIMSVFVAVVKFIKWYANDVESQPQ